MDRTSEFNTFLGRNPTVHLTKPNATGDDSEGSVRTGFNNEAARIGQDIHIAQLKLDELGKRTFYFYISNMFGYSC